MPKSKASPQKSKKQSEPVPAVAPLEQVRRIADALCRAAHECCHQHERSARVFAKTQMPAEERAAEQLCALADTLLATLTAEYGQVAGQLRPDPAQAPWWHRANALWLASREFTRRHHSGDDASHAGTTKHAARELGTMQVEFELEASALLALRQACEDYSRSRPDVL